MIKTISEREFIDAFDDMGREDNFSYDGRRALFDYFEEFEDSTGEQIEFDVIGICCDFSEYEDWEAFRNDHPSTASEIEDVILPEFEEDDTLTKEDYHEELLDKLEHYTTVIRIDSESFIISAF